MPALHYLAAGHAYRLLVGFLDRIKPPLADLLAKATLIKGYNLICALILKICRGIVEGYMRVFADSYKSKVNGLFTKNCSDVLNRLFRVGSSVYKVCRPERDA